MSAKIVDLIQLKVIGIVVKKNTASAWYISHAPLQLKIKQSKPIEKDFQDHLKNNTWVYCIYTTLLIGSLLLIKNYHR